MYDEVVVIFVDGIFVVFWKLNLKILDFVYGEMYLDV